MYGRGYELRDIYVRRRNAFVCGFVWLFGYAVIDSAHANEAIKITLSFSICTQHLLCGSDALVVM